MSIKHILITEPANPILRRLAMGFLHKPDLLLVCFDREKAVAKSICCGCSSPRNKATSSSEIARKFL